MEIGLLNFESLVNLRQLLNFRDRNLFIIKSLKVELNPNFKHAF